ncbi:MAG TPA: hypothetical protein VG013_21995, partial [Gemmataceae bacterium]|nr:hypothetical protein [Gemmataceae bacterium]
HFRELPDSRRRGKVVYPIDEILLLCLPRGVAAEHFLDGQDAAGARPVFDSGMRVAPSAGTP